MPNRDIHRLLRDRLSAVNMTMAEASRRIDRNAAYLQQFLERGSPKELPEPVRERLGPLLGVTPDDLRATPPRTKAPRRVAEEDQHPAPIPLPNLTSDLPVLGAARGGEMGKSIFADNGSFFEMTQRPPALVNVRDAYAVYVVDDSMEPRYFAGELAHVHPHKVVRPGTFVIVQTITPDGERDFLVKRFVRRADGKVHLQQYNPAKTFTIDAETVLAMHKIVGSLEPA